MTPSDNAAEPAAGISAPSRRPLGRRRFVLVLVAGAVLCLCAGFAAALLVKSPAQVAADAKAPTAGLITAPLTKRPIANTVVVRGDAAYADGSDVTLSPGGAGGVPAIATGHIPVVGQVLQAGSIALEVSSRPVVVLPGALPSFRKLRIGVSGSDVLQFKAALAELGIDPGDASSNEFDAATAEAVSALYELVGYPAPKDESASPGAVRAAEAAVRNAGQQVAAAQRALDAAGAGPSEVDRLMAQQAVDAAQQQLDAALAGGADAAIASAQTALALSRARQEEVLSPRDTAAEAAALADAEAAAADAQAALENAQQAAMPIVPAGELLFLAALPRQVDKVSIGYGAPVDAAPVFSVAGTTLTVTARVSARSAAQISPGAAATIDLPGLTPVPVTVTTVTGASAGGAGPVATPSPSGGAPDPGGTPEGGTATITLSPGPDVAPEQRAEVAGQNVRIVIPVSATEGEVWAVPLSCVTAGPDGGSRIEVATDAASGRTRLVSVELGLAADGYVEIAGLDEPLSADMLVVLGR